MSDRMTARTDVPLSMNNFEVRSEDTRSLSKTCPAIAPGNRPPLKLATLARQFLQISCVLPDGALVRPVFRHGSR